MRWLFLGPIIWICTIVLWFTNVAFFSLNFSLLPCRHFKIVTRVTRNASVHIYELMSWTAVQNSPRHIPNIINPDSGLRFGLCECYVPCSINHFVFFYGLAASYCEWGKWPRSENNRKVLQFPLNWRCILPCLWRVLSGGGTSLHGSALVSILDFWVWFRVSRAFVHSLLSRDDSRPFPHSDP